MCGFEGNNLADLRAEFGIFADTKHQELPGSFPCPDKVQWCNGKLSAVIYLLVLGTVFEYGWLHFFLISFDVYISQHYVSHFLTTLSGLSP